jgi:phosphoglycolate phosphatase-like HAD superfamily hydrolase
MRLILFDIDGTLLLDDGAAREAYAIALKEVFGFVRGLKVYDFSGRTDPQITHMVLSDAGITRETIEEGMPRLWPRYLEELEIRTIPERVRLMPGVVELLEGLSERSDVVMGLLTGNIEPGARIKLGARKLNHYFPFGAFGSDSSNRVELPPVAIARAKELYGHEFVGREVVIIGDSVWDVRCAAPYGATTIAVSTGVTKRETLEAEKPDFLFETIEPRDEVLRAVLGS